MTRTKKPAPRVEHKTFGRGVVINRFCLSNYAGKVLTVKFDGDRARMVLLLPAYWITDWAELLAAWDAALTEPRKRLRSEPRFRRVGAAWDLQTKIQKLDNQNSRNQRV